MPAPRAPLVIVNPIAGNGRAHKLAPRIEAWLAQRGLNARLVETRERGHAERLAAAAGGLGHDRVVVVGGDGTIQEVVNGVLADGQLPPDRRLSIGLVPAGSGNDLVRDLALPIDPIGALPAAFGDEERPIDVAVAEDAQGRIRHFVAAGGVGFDAQVAHVMFRHRMPWQKGRVGYFLSTFIELMRFRNRRLQLLLRNDDGDVLTDRISLLVAVANGPYLAGGMQICPDADLADGLLDLCVAGDLSRLEALRLLPGMYKGAHVGHPKVEFLRVRSVQFEGDLDARVHLDGEPFGTIPLTVSVLPLALRVAIGQSGTVPV
ncbi:MAG TPA: diacylglycerol kinase family protein [Candidatus Dormibacteraeota bacterium]|nr:diacylglycerol kinase family protein [Candidatus Dormibacteraeota bacterium]